MTPENQIKLAICDWLSAHKIFVFQHDSVGIFDPVKKRYRISRTKYRLKGVADILGLLPTGKFIAIEVKTKSGRLTPEQEVFLDRVSENGGIAFVARSVDDVRCALDRTGTILR